MGAYNTTSERTVRRKKVQELHRFVHRVHAIKRMQTQKHMQS